MSESEAEIEISPRPLIRNFKEALQSFSCRVCGFGFETMYGDIGKRFIEAHHVEPIGLREGDVTTLITDLVPVCSN
jgi:5-methylcytosine-specific restriction protein A